MAATAAPMLVTPLAQAAAKPVLTVGITQDQENLNPALQPTFTTITMLAYGALTRDTSTGRVVPALATSWRYLGSGNKTFQFTLRKGVEFSDGTPFNAQAVKKWIDYFIHVPQNAHSQALPIKSVSVSGSSKVTLHLSAPDPEVAYQFSDVNGNIGFVASPKAVADPKMLNVQSDGVGPYVAVPSKSESGSAYTFVANKNYYDQKAIHFSEVVVKTITSPATMLAAIESGQIDVAEGDVTTATAAASHGLHVVKVGSGWDGLLLMDRGTELPDGKTPNPLANAQVRQALSYAIDRKAIAKSLLPGAATPTSEAPTTDGYIPSLAQHYAYDPGKARKLLAAAGYPNGFTFDALSMGWYGTLGDTLMQAVAQNFSAVGVTLSLKSDQQTPWVTDFLAKTYSASGFVQNPLLSMFGFYQDYLIPGTPSTLKGTDDPMLDHLYAKALVAKNPEPYWQAISKRVVMQAEVLPVVDDDAFVYTNGHIGGVDPTPENSEMLPVQWYPSN